MQCIPGHHFNLELHELLENRGIHEVLDCRPLFPLPHLLHSPAIFASTQVKQLPNGNEDLRDMLCNNEKSAA